MKIKICITLIFLLPILANAQEGFTSKKSEFGISLEVNTSNKNITLGDLDALMSNGFNGIEAQNSFGFGLGIMYQHQFNSFLAGRFQGVLVFLENELVYKDGFADFVRKQELVKVEFPLHLVLENKNKRIAPSFIMGGKYSYDLGKKGATSSLGSFKNEDFLLDFGVGVTFKTKLFKFKPELIYSRGMINQVKKDLSAPLNNTLDKAFEDRFTLRFLFFN